MSCRFVDSLQKGSVRNVLILFASLQKGVFHCKHSNGICHAGLLTACKRDQYGTSWSFLQAVNKPAWHIPLLCLQWKTPDDGQRNCPKYVEFYSKNKFWQFSASSWFYYKTCEETVDCLQITIECSSYSSSVSRIVSIHSSVLYLCWGSPLSLHHFDLYVIDLFIYIFSISCFFLIERLSGFIISFPLILFIND